MNINHDPEAVMAAWLDDGPAELPTDTRQAIAVGIRSTTRRRARRFRFDTGTWGRPNAALRMSVAAATIAILAVTVAIGLNYFVNQQGLLGLPPGTELEAESPIPTPRRSVGLGIFEPLAGRIVYGSEKSIYGIEDGIWGLDPGSSDPATAVQLTSEPGTPLGWSADGTRLLIQKGGENLYILHADGSETQLTDQLSEFPASATISPDGSRVVFPGPEATSGHGGTLYSVDADDGQVELLFESQMVGGGITNPTFSPDGTQIAFTDGRTGNRSVWVMNANGSDAHPIVAGENTPIDDATHVHSLAWSPAGDRIALSLFQGIYTFAPDGSDFTRLIATPYETNSPGAHWSPDGSQIAYTTRCTFWDDGVGHGCLLAIVDADGSEWEGFSYGIAGPWHPGTPDSVEPTQ